MTNAQPRRRGGGVVRMVLGILVLVLALLGTLGNLATGQIVASGGAAETFGAVLGRLILIAIASRCWCPACGPGAARAPSPRTGGCASPLSVGCRGAIRSDACPPPW